MSDYAHHRQPARLHELHIDKILLHDPFPGEPLPSLPEEGFFSHMLYVKKKKKEATDNKA